MPLSVKAAPPPAADTSFLLDRRQPWIMGVLNATPDSFYAGSRLSSLDNALQVAGTMIQEGASCLDIGGESTRPGAADISAVDELDRVLPLIEALRERFPQVLLSIDTQKAVVAREALSRGVGVVNDVSSLQHDPAMVEVVASSDCPVVLMHRQGTSQTMQAHPAYGDVVSDVKRFFEERLAFAARHHIAEERVILDPGIGFGKTVDHNVTLLQRLSEFLSLGRPLLVGVSRKSFIGALLNEPSPENRLEGSLAAGLWAIQAGASGLRVHDVGATSRALRMWTALQGSAQ